MIVESIRQIGLNGHAQLVARVFVERSEIVKSGDLLPYFEGKRYRAIGHMTLIDAEDWQCQESWVVTVGAKIPERRLVEVVVIEKGPPPTEAQEARRPRGKLEQLSLPAPSQAKRKHR